MGTLKNDAIGFDAAFRAKAAAAIDEFEGALDEFVGEAAPAGTDRLRDAADRMIRIVASVMIRLD